MLLLVSDVIVSGNCSVQVLCTYFSTTTRVAACTDFDVWARGTPWTSLWVSGSFPALPLALFFLISQVIFMVDIWLKTMYSNRILLFPHKHFLQLK